MVQKSRKDSPKIDSRVRSRIKKIIKILNTHNIVFKELILFGSQARGDARPDSDIDICIVVDEKRRDPLETQRAANLWVAVAGIAADFVGTSVTQYKKDFVSPLLHEVRKHGISVSKLL